MTNLIVGDGNIFTAAISNALDSSVLLQPSNETNLNWFNSNSKIFYGDSTNERLVSSILESEKVRKFFIRNFKKNTVLSLCSIRYSSTVFAKTFF